MAEQNRPTVAKTTPAASKATAAEPKRNKDGSIRKPPVRKNRPALDFSAIKVTKATDQTLSTFRRTRGERSPQQKAVDTLVRQVHEAWVSAGKPQDWKDQQGVAVHLSVPVAQYETMEWHLRKAGEYFDVAIRLSDRRDVDGYAEFVFLAKDKPVKADDKSQPGSEVKNASGGDAAAK